MAKVFISYSRKDIEFAKKLTAELKKSDLDFWIDWEGIPPTVDWWKEIEKGIEEADIFLFLISPDSAKSKICGQEIDVAVKNGKRIVPIVVREIVWEDTPPQLGHLNYIFFSRDDDFDTATIKLMTAIQTDYEWAATHRRLQVKALEWERNNKENSYLLRGKDLQDAEIQLRKNSSKEPFPTDLQFEYVSASRKAEELQQRLTQRRKAIVSTIGVALLVLIALATTGMFNRYIYRPVDMEDYWVTIPAGEFEMGTEYGAPDEQPVHAVYVDEFQIGKYEITNNQYNQCIRASICIGNTVPENLDHPVVDINWYAAKTYCEWMGGRLPTEAEWEKAASWNVETQTKFVYPWGNDDPTSALLNYDITHDDTTPVGSYPAGVNGLFDMAGNAWEWTSSLYQLYPYDATDGREDMSSTDGRVMRGGSWLLDDTVVRSALRYWDNPTNTYIDIGFRCARDSSP